MNLLVIGASGQVGSALIARARELQEIDRVTGVSRSSGDGEHRLDLTIPSSVTRVMEVVRPTHVILASASTNVAWCEANASAAHEVNVEGPRAVAAACDRQGARLVLVSSDYVFDGHNGPYSEIDPCNPINVYGVQKLEAEQIVLGAGHENLILRTCQIFGQDSRRVNFVLRTVDAIKAGEMVGAAVDLFGTPTYAPDFARVAFDLIIAGAHGIWHAAGGEFVSRHQLAIRAAIAFGADPDRVRESRSDELADAVPRPRRAGLRCARLRTQGVGPMRSLDAALQDFALLEAAV